MLRPEGRKQQFGDDARRTRKPAIDLHLRHVLVREKIATAAKPCADDADHVRRLQPAGREAGRKIMQALRTEGRFKLGKPAECQAEHTSLTADHRLDLAAPAVGAPLAEPLHQSAPKASWPADSSERSNRTSPLYWPEYSSAAIWNGPVTVPKSGMTTCQLRIAPEKKAERTSSSEA